MRRLVRLAVCALLCFLPYIASAHHSLTEWDPNVIVELEGGVVSVVWANPHVRFRVKVVNAAARPRPLRFSDRRLSTELLPVEEEKIHAAIRDADGIFRVWGRDRTSLGRFPDESMLTDAAKAAKAAFDPRTDLPHLDCIPPGSFSWRPGRELEPFECEVWEGEAQ